jgi:hypothetical protein
MLEKGPGYGADRGRGRSFSDVLRSQATAEELYDATREAYAIATANSAGIDPGDVAEAVLQLLKRQRSKK